jgi:hypothetical protein
VMSDSEKDEDDDMISEDDEAMEKDKEAQIVDDSAAANTKGNDLPLKSSTTPPRPYDAEYAADIDTLYTLNNLPRNLLLFPQWAFGADGIPSIQVLAYGDFSFKGRFRWENHILCRQAWKVRKRREGITTGDDKDEKVLPFRPIRDSDVKMMELVSENMDFLGACPADSIVIKSDE